MRTEFSEEQLRDPDLAEANQILRNCVHCGFCTATCPTYVLLGDELDSPRGRIYLIKEMLEQGRAATPDVVKHVDRCLSCLSCMTTCPASVNYMHLVDHARIHIEETYTRPLPDRLMRAFLAAVLPYPARFRLAALAGFLAKPLAPFLRPVPGLKRLAAMADLAPARLPARSTLEGVRHFPAHGPKRGRVALMASCVHPVLRPDLNETTIRLLNRHGVEVVLAEGEGCCGALPHHMGKKAQSHALAKRNIDSWIREMDSEGLDAIVINLSGCGTTVKDYGFMFRNDPDYAEKAARVSGAARDISQYMAEIGLQAPVVKTGAVVAYHSACSLQHGQKVTAEPKTLLGLAGFAVRDVPEAHLCCGSAGTYNMLQPEIAQRLARRKAANIESLRPDIIAAGNLGCMTQIAGASNIPIVHTVELLDWATGGPKPPALDGLELEDTKDRPAAAPTG